jgi:hypothetical protein
VFEKDKLKLSSISISKMLTNKKGHDPGNRFAAEFLIQFHRFLLPQALTIEGSQEFSEFF